MMKAECMNYVVMPRAEHYPTLQKDETCSSKSKRRGNNRPQRIRREGSQWASVVAITNAYQKAKEVFVSRLESRQSDTIGFAHFDNVSFFSWNGP